MYILLYSIVNPYCFCFLYTVYLTFKSPHLPLPLHQCFPPHCRIFAYRGAGGLYACKNRASMSCYRNRQLNGGENGHVTEVVTLMKGEWSCYRNHQFNGGSMVMLWRWPV